MFSSPIALAALVGANLLPLVGVLFFDWSLFAVILLYWAENGVIGVFNILKMLAAGSGGWRDNLSAKAADAGPGDTGPGDAGSNDVVADKFGARAFLIPFFTIHYGIFWVVHGVFVFVLFGSNGNGLGVDAEVLGQAVSGGLWIGLLGLVTSHGMSFGLNYIGNGEYRRASPDLLMSQPYGRVVVLHVTIIFGGMATQALGQPLWALLLMVSLKIGVDIWAHLREHQKMAADGDSGSTGRERMREAFEALEAQRYERGDKRGEQSPARLADRQVAEQDVIP